MVVDLSCNESNSGSLLVIVFGGIFLYEFDWIGLNNYVGNGVFILGLVGGIY